MPITSCNTQHIVHRLWAHKIYVCGVWVWWCCGIVVCGLCCGVWCVLCGVVGCVVWCCGVCVCVCVCLVWCFCVFVTRGKTPRVHSKRPRVFRHHAHMCKTSGRGARTHADVLNEHTEGVLNVHTETCSMHTPLLSSFSPSLLQRTQTHTQPHTHNNAQPHTATHNNTAQHNTTQHRTRHTEAKRREEERQR